MDNLRKGYIKFMNKGIRKKISRETWVRLAFGAIGIVLLVAIEIGHPGFYQEMIGLLGTGDVHHIAQVLQSYGPMAMVISFVLDVVVNMAGFLPSIFFSTANGLVFGLVPGILISWLAECVGVTISFVIMRYLLRDSAAKIIQKHKFLLKVDDFSGKNGLQVMLFARAIPYFPSGIITALGAISQISLRDYIIANLIGKFPSTALEVVVGHDAIMFKTHLSRLTIIIIGATVVYGLAWYLHKRYQKHREAQQADREAEKSQEHTEE